MIKSMEIFTSNIRQHAREKTLLLPSQVLLMLLNTNPDRQSQRNEPIRFTQSWPSQAWCGVVHSSISGRNIKKTVIGFFI